MTGRAEAVYRTRVRIIQAARDVFSEDAFHLAPVDEVARRARVSRATVYYQFGSKVGLIEAVIDDVERVAGLARIRAAAELPDSLDALRETMLRGVRYWARERALARRLIGLATIAPDVRRILHRRDKQRLTIVTALVERLRAQDRLRADVSMQRAIDVLGLLSSFEAFDLLYRQRRSSSAAIAAVLTEIAERTLTKRPSSPSRPTSRRMVSARTL